MVIDSAGSLYIMGSSFVIVIYPSTVNGNATPSRIIQGALTQLGVSNIAVDKSGNIYPDVAEDQEWQHPAHPAQLGCNGHLDWTQGFGVRQQPQCPGICQPPQLWFSPTECPRLVQVCTR
jgi:hypothetical protein